MRGPPEPPDRSVSVWWMSRWPPSGQPVAPAASALGSQPPGHVPGGAAGSRAGAGAGCCAPACCQEVSPRCPVFVNGASAPRRDGRWGREVSGCSTRGHTAASGAATATWPRRPRARSGGAREAALGPQSPARRELGSGTAGLLLEPLDAGTAEPWGAASRDRLSAAWHGGLLDLLPCVTQGLAHADSAHPGGRRCDTGCRSLCRA